MLSQEAEKYPQDQVLIEEMNMKIVIEDTFELSISSDGGGGGGGGGGAIDNREIAKDKTAIENRETAMEKCETEKCDAENIYKKLLLNYFSSSGRELNWERIRKDLI